MKIILIAFLVSIGYMPNSSITKTETMEKFRIEGIILKTKSDYKNFLKEYPEDPLGAGSFGGPRVKIFVNSRPSTNEQMIVLLMDEWERKTGERPYSAKLTAAGWGDI